MIKKLHSRQKAIRSFWWHWFLCKLQNVEKYLTTFYYYYVVKNKYSFSLLQLPFNVMYIFCFISNPICNFFAVLLYNLISLFKSLMCSKCWCQWLPWFKAIIFSSQMSSAHFFSLRIKFRINRKVSFWSEYFSTESNLLQKMEKKLRFDQWLQLSCWRITKFWKHDLVILNLPIAG